MVLCRRRESNSGFQLVELQHYHRAKSAHCLFFQYPVLDSYFFSISSTGLLLFQYPVLRSYCFKIQYWTLLVSILLWAHPHTDTKHANVQIHRVTRGLNTQNTNTWIRFTYMLTNANMLKCAYTLHAMHCLVSQWVASCMMLAWWQHDS